MTEPSCSLSAEMRRSADRFFQAGRNRWRTAHLPQPNTRSHLGTASCLKIKPGQFSKGGTIGAQAGDTTKINLRLKVVSQPRQKGPISLTLFGQFGTIINCEILNFNFTKLPPIRWGRKVVLATTPIEPEVSNQFNVILIYVPIIIFCSLFSCN